MKLGIACSCLHTASAAGLTRLAASVNAAIGAAHRHGSTLLGVTHSSRGSWFSAAAAVGVCCALALPGSAPAQPLSATPSRTQPYLACAPPIPRHAACQSVVVPPAARLASLAVGSFPASKGVYGSGFAPGDLQAAYRLPSETAGAGQTVAIVDAYNDPSAESELATYRSAYGLAPCTAANGCFSTVGHVGGPRSLHEDDGWALEVSVDVDMVSAICPQCHILLVEASSDSFEDLAAAENAAVALGATEISNSWAGSEFDGEKSLEPAFTHPGIPITFASGDSGYENHESPVEPNVPSYPAGSPNVIAVGGTTLSAAANARGWSESAWSHSGSGCSLYEPKPWFQTDTACSHRMANDVSAVAEHLSVYSSRSWLTVGGTSAAAPIIAAVEALASPAARSLGAAAFYESPSSLFDAASGSNGSCGGSYLCSAGAGYDGPTGVGTPDGAYITGLRLTSVGLAPAPRGTSAVPISTTHPDKREPGTIVTYTDVHDGTTTFTVQRLLEGRRHGHSCVRPTRRNAGRAACTRIVTVGAFTRSDSAGTNRFRFTGRVAGRALTPGRYRLRAAPADALGAGQVTYVPFRIRRR